MCVCVCVCVSISVSICYVRMCVFLFLVLYFFHFSYANATNTLVKWKLIYHIKQIGLLTPVKKNVAAGGAGALLAVSMHALFMGDTSCTTDFLDLSCTTGLKLIRAVRVSDVVGGTAFYKNLL